MKLRLWKFEARFFGLANYASCFLGALMFAAIVGPGLEAQALTEQKRVELHEQQLAQLKVEQHEVACLTNVAVHEARGEIQGVRELVAKTVLAIVDDGSMSLPKSVCGLAKVRGFFSQLKDAEKERFEDAAWTKVYAEMFRVYNGPRALPRGWGCVRGFRVSDDQLEKLAPKQIAQLGFTQEAKGLKYFAAHRVPVDTRGSITFYAPRGGCSEPTPTI